MVAGQDSTPARLPVAPAVPLHGDSRLRRPADARGRRGVVLVHSFFCNRGLWNPLDAATDGEAVFRSWRVTLEPAFGSIDRYLDTIEARGRPPRASRPEWHRSWSATAWADCAIRAWCAPRARRPLSSGHHHRDAASRHLDRAHARTAERLEVRIDGPWLQALGLSRRGDGAHRRSSPAFLGSLRQHRLSDPQRATLPGADNRHLCRNAARRDDLPPGSLRLRCFERCRYAPSTASDGSLSDATARLDFHQQLQRRFRREVEQV